MNIDLRRWMVAVSFAIVLLLGSSNALLSQPPQAGPTTAVLASLTIKTDVDRAQVMTVMPDEVRATLRLYLDGKIQQWYARTDGRGVLFILNSTSVADAKTVMDELPLSKANLANLEYTPLGPLTPLRALLAIPSAGSGKDDR